MAAAAEAAILRDAAARRDARRAAAPKRHQHHHHGRHGGHSKDGSAAKALASTRAKTEGIVNPPTVPAAVAAMVPRAALLELWREVLLLPSGDACVLRQLRDGSRQLLFSNGNVASLDAAAVAAQAKKKKKQQAAAVNGATKVAPQHIVDENATRAWET